LIIAVIYSLPSGIGGRANNTQEPLLPKTCSGRLTTVLVITRLVCLKS